MPTPIPDPAKVLTPTQLANLANIRDIFADQTSCPLEEIPVYMIRVEFRVHSDENSGTDDPVYIQIGNSNTKYYLNKGLNDFKRGAYCYYTITPTNVKKVSDINRLRIGKGGNDQLRLHWVKLYINGEYTDWIFRKAFGTGGRIDNGSVITIGETELKNFRNGLSNSCRGRLPKFKVFPQSKTIQFYDDFTIPDKIFEEFIETGIGNAINNNKLYWGGKDGEKYVGCWHTSGTRSRIHVSIDLKYDLKLRVDLGFSSDSLISFPSFNVNLPDPEIDYSFDILITCTNNKILFKSENQNIGGNIVTDTYATLYNMVEAVDDYLKNSLKDLDNMLTAGLSKLAFDFSLVLPAVDLSALGLPGYTFVSTCPNIHVTDGGTIRFTWS